jgi:hypothetical protein
MAVGICHADQVATSIRIKLALTSLTSDSCSVGIVRLRTEATEFFLCVFDEVNKNVLQRNVS